MPQRGPITQAELFAVLESTTDPLYLAPFIERGYGSGLESLEAICNVLARVSAAIDRTAQAMFILPWSGQTNPPAAGASLATGTLNVTRTLRAELPLTLLAGVVLYEEVEVDWSREGGIPVLTTREYTLRNDFTFLPGEMGPVSLDIVSTTPGYGYANPLPDTIIRVAQPGSGFSNTRASVVQGATTAGLVVAPEPDVVVPEHVGQYVEFTAGANAGQVRLAGGYVRATAGINGGSLSLLPIFVVRDTSVGPSGTFIVGESVEQSTAGVVTATGRLRAVTPGLGPWFMVIEYASGTFLETAGPVGNIIGVSSTAQFFVEVGGIITDPFLVSEATTASWRVLDWTTGFGLTVTNPTSPLPGDLAMLDTLGAERKLPRAPGESDDSYRLRMAKVGDLISPNAISRVGNRVWSQYGITICLREVGHALFPGMFCEGDAGNTASLANYSYDLDCIRMQGLATSGFPFADGERVVQDNGGVLTVGRVVSYPAPFVINTPGVYPASHVTALLNIEALDVARIRGPGFVAGVPIVGDLTGASFMPGLFEGSLRVQDRFKLNLDYTEFRAFFLVGLPPTALGEFGLAFDDGPSNAFDAAPYLAYCDGFPLTGAVLNRTTWQAIDNARAGGVGFDLVLDTSGCV